MDLEFVILVQAGVYNASVFLPNMGNCYLQKTDQEGNLLWANYLFGSMQIGDKAPADSSEVIIGKLNGTFSYQGEQFGSTTSYSMYPC